MSRDLTRCFIGQLRRGGKLKQGKTYYYRVIAKNESGESDASNVVAVKIGR